MSELTDSCLFAIINVAHNPLAPIDDLHSYHISFPPGYNGVLVSENARYDDSYLYFSLEGETAFIVPNNFCSEFNKIVFSESIGN